MEGEGTVGTKTLSLQMFQFGHLHLFTHFSILAVRHREEAASKNCKLFRIDWRESPYVRMRMLNMMQYVESKIVRNATNYATVGCLITSIRGLPFTPQSFSRSWSKKRARDGHTHLRNQHLSMIKARMTYRTIVTAFMIMKS